MYYKLGQACVTNWSSFVLLQIRANVWANWGIFIIEIGASFVANWGSYYKLGQPLLQNRAAITNCGKMYYKLGQVLQIRAIITNWDITSCNFKFVSLVYVKALSISYFKRIEKGKQLVVTISTFMEAGDIILLLYFRLIVLSNLSGFLTMNVENLLH